MSFTSKIHIRQPEEARNSHAASVHQLQDAGFRWIPPFLQTRLRPGASPSGRDTINLARAFHKRVMDISVRTIRPLLPATKLISEVLEMKGTFFSPKQVVEKDLKLV